jgi:hypothetical protein
MRLRLLPLLLLPCCAGAQKQAPDLLRHHDNDRWNISGGLAGGSMNFQQNGNLGFTAQFSYNLFQGKRSSLSIDQGLTLGTEDEYGVSFFPVLAVAIFTSPVAQSVDLSDGHRIAAYADFPLLLHYNFGAGAVRGTQRSSKEMVGFYIGAGGTHTFTAYTNTFSKAAQTDYWAWAVDGGIRLRGSKGGITCIGIGVEQPLRSPIGPIHNPLFFKISLTGLGKF